MKYIYTLLLVLISFICIGQVQPKFKKKTKEEVLKKSTYILSYNETYEIPYWVSYIVYGDSLDIKNFDRQDDFRKDTCVSTGSAVPDDYKNSGYDKGHLLPAADRDYNIDYLSETFLMSNMTPQLPSFNRGIWKRLEDYERNLAKKYKKVSVITGTIFYTKNPKMIGKNNVGVPDAFFKIIIYRSKVECYIIPQSAKKSESPAIYIVKLEEVSKQTDLKFPIH